MRCMDVLEPTQHLRQHCGTTRAHNLFMRGMSPYGTFELSSPHALQSKHTLCAFLGIALHMLRPYAAVCCSLR